MIEKNEIEKVWFIEDNKVKKANKIVSKISYKDIEIPVLKTERESFCQDFLFKDKNNEYWSMKIIGIDFKNFIHVSFDNPLPERTEYCNNFLKILSEFDLLNYFSERIANEQYFNACQLKYISLFHPEMYEQAKMCRERIIDKNRKISAENKNKIEQEQKEKVKTTNEKFNKRLEEIKLDIRMGKTVQVENFEFYKDDKYENGLTIQNCFLYLARQYGIDIPLATQGFINNRLVKYNFQTGEYSYFATKSKTVSTKMHEYLDRIYKEVNNEFQKSTEQIREQLKRIKEAR